MEVAEKEKKYKYLAKNTLLFSLSTLGSKILVFLLIPLYTAFLSQSDYGLADILATTIDLLLFIFSLDISVAALRFTMEKEKGKKNVLSFSLLVFFLGFILLSGILIILLSTKAINFDVEKYFYIFLLATYFLRGLSDIFTAYLKGLDKIKIVAISGILLTISTIIANVILVAVLKKGLFGYLLGTFIGYVITVLFMGFFIRKDLFSKPDFSVVNKKEMILFSLPLIFDGIGWWANNALDKYFIVFMEGKDASGIYAASSKMPAFLLAIIVIYINAWLLTAIKEYSHENDETIFAENYTSIALFLTASCSILITFNEQISKILFAPAFNSAKLYAPFLLVAFVFSGLANFLGTIYTARKSSKFVAISSMCGAIVNCVLNYFLIKEMGIMGAAISTLVSFFVIWLVRMIFLKKHLKKTHITWEMIVSFVIILGQGVLCYYGIVEWYWQLLCLALLLLINIKSIKICINVLKLIFSKSKSKEKVND